MEHRYLAPGIAIAPIMFGANIFGWTADKAMSFRLLDRFVERGFNAIDTADVYGKGMSEALIGEWLGARGRRDDVVIASKIGYSEQHKGLSAANIAAGIETKVGYGEQHKGLSAANIAAGIEGSLRRLRTDYVDVYFAHIYDPHVLLDETLEAFDRLIRAGKVRAIGASNHSAAQLSEALERSAALGTTPYTVLQPPYNLYDRDSFEGGLRELALDKQIGVVSYFGLASGFLSGKYRSEADLADRPRSGLVKGYLDARGLRILDAMDAAAATTGANLAQIAIAWLIGRPGITAPIVSATSIGQLDEILDAANLVLPQDVRIQLDAASRTDVSA